MDTFERLRKILMAHYPLQPESITRDAALEQLEIDSLGIMELFFAIEDEFQISVPHDRRDMKSVGDVADYIDELILRQQDSPSVSSHAGRAEGMGIQRT